MTVSIRELDTEAEWRSAYPVMRQLRPDVGEDEYVDLLTTMQPEGYRLFALSVDDQPVSLAGVSILTNLYDGRHVWVYDLVTDVEHRSNGYGGKLLEYLEDWARERGCGVITLSSGLQRTDAHRFYEERTNMNRSSYVFKKAL